MIRRMLFYLIVIVAMTSFTAFGEESEGLVVHEWGVWVRTSTIRGTMWSSPEVINLGNCRPLFVWLRMSTPRNDRVTAGTSR